MAKESEAVSHGEIWRQMRQRGAMCDREGTRKNGDKVSCH